MDKQQEITHKEYLQALDIVRKYHKKIFSEAEAVKILHSMTVSDFLSKFKFSRRLRGALISVVDFHGHKLLIDELDYDTFIK